ncbi:MAG TPA: SRPBCC family protein [Noviherbaspirillum sp.]|uniref:SRPBCC family protein n=1 Tax=Noviherbaspirillum sp. TaxID=1926288 RepID=UPI002B49ED1E|nr:SRPBCC family protein [Noviherbaspirillum sp.]HJV85836.1 SRPBCC family protein [Noviherbaspirillum sp.]
MDEQSSKTQSLAFWVAGAALGALTMYLADPDRGRRRRALATDKMRSLATKTSDAIDVASRDLNNRVHGLRAQAGRMFSQHSETSDDDTVVARVRKEIGRAVTHPRAIKANAQNGCVTLHGPVLAHEKDKLIECVRSVAGVKEVQDYLDVHDNAVGVPSLQGEGKMRRAAGSAIMQETWPPALRAVAAVGGSALGLFGLMRRSPASAAAAAIGIGLLARGISNRSFSRMMQTGRQSSVDMHKTIYIQASPEDVYDMWTRYENFPRFMSNVQDVRDLGNGRSHWIVSGPAGTHIEWDSVITDAQRPERLAWRSDPDSTVQHTGMVHFEPESNGTRVSVHMTYSPPAGAVGHAVASLFNGNPKRQMEEDLMRMKSFIETGIPSRDAAQATSRAGAAGTTSIH